MYLEGTDACDVIGVQMLGWRDRWGGGGSEGDVAAREGRCGGLAQDT